jgi:carboxyl-terminal processing protease
MEVAQLYNQTTDDHRGNIVVLSVFKDSPAEKQGIQGGDVILEVTGVKTANHDFQDILHNHLRGSAGAEVRLKLFRSSTKQIMNISVSRVPMVY